MHLLASGAALTFTLGALYLGWYHWPGWYLTEVLRVVGVMVGVDVVLGPLVTLIIASAKKPHRELARDIALIVVVQLAALIHGVATLWNGQPIYYAFSADCLSVVQAYAIDRESLALARQQKLPLVPHWYRLPRWIWAPLPKDADKAQAIAVSAPEGGADVIAMPQYYKSWDERLPELRQQLQRVDQIRYITPKEKNALKERMGAAGLATDQANAIALTGHGRPLFAVVDLASLKITAVLRAT